LVLILCVAYENRAKAAVLSLDQLPYPSAVALSLDEGKWIYKSFPALLPLYIFDGEPEGQPTCDKTCSAVWPIVQAQRNDKPMGLWTIVPRDDGRLQWAFKNKPLYTYFEDSSIGARGIGKNMDWYLDDGAIAYLRRAGVSLPPSATQAERKRGEQKKMLSVLLPPLN
jgi:predicted lipoprotein with Yx(FWY)xxD motif